MRNGTASTISTTFTISARGVVQLWKIPTHCKPGHCKPASLWPGEMSRFCAMTPIPGPAIHGADSAHAVTHRCACRGRAGWPALAWLSQGCAGLSQGWLSSRVSPGAEMEAQFLHKLDSDPSCQHIRRWETEMYSLPSGNYWTLPHFRYCSVFAGAKVSKDKSPHVLLSDTQVHWEEDEAQMAQWPES